MGQKNQKPKKNLDSTSKDYNYKEEKVTKSSFEFINIIGRGGFGKVWKVYHKKYKKIYAMKEMSKAKIIDKRSEKSIKSERDLLQMMNHPFIVNMHFSFQDNDHLFIAMDFLTGGDLRYHIFRQKKFSEEETKFFLACIIISLEYIHTNNILHRDLKPENLVMDEKGYLKLTDFGIAKIYQKENYKETSGTPGYMAPEVMCGQNHTIAVDYFALGVIGYEFMNGVRPYMGKNRKEIKNKILSTQVQLKKNKVPRNWSVESADFINNLIQRKPANRLGLRGATEVKEHMWFKNYDWKGLYLGKLKAPFRPEENDNFDFNYCNAREKIGVSTQERYYKIINGSKYKNAFVDFYYFDRLGMLKKTGKIKSKFVNPHLKYLKEEKNENNYNSNNVSSNFVDSNNDIYSVNKNLSDKIIKNYGTFMKKNDLSIISSTNNNSKLNESGFLGSDIRKLSSYKSTKVLLKSYGKRSASALTRNIKDYRESAKMDIATNEFEF